MKVVEAVFEPLGMVIDVFPVKSDVLKVPLLNVILKLRLEVTVCSDVKTTSNVSPSL